MRRATRNVLSILTVLWIFLASRSQPLQGTRALTDLQSAIFQISISSLINCFKAHQEMKLAAKQFKLGKNIYVCIVRTEQLLFG